MRRAFMTDPDLLMSLEGQQYLVLRPTGPVESFYDAEQARLLEQSPISVPHPNTGHVTLRGFAEPTRVHALKKVLTNWAAHHGEIELRVEAVDAFPSPFQILFGRLERTTSLVNAYASLTSALDVTDFMRIGELPLDQWVFHLSMVYCGTLSEPEWQKLSAQVCRAVDLCPSETVTEAEFVWYEDGVEHAEVIPLGSNEIRGR